MSACVVPIEPERGSGFLVERVFLTPTGVHVAGKRPGVRSSVGADGLFEVAPGKVAGDSRQQHDHNPAPGCRSAAEAADRKLCESGKSPKKSHQSEDNSLQKG